MAAPTPSVTDLVRDVENTLSPELDSIDWAEDEIAAASRRHPRVADTLHHSFMLLKPTSNRMRTEFVYRAHCRELLERVAREDDTRRGTAAEAVIALLAVATVAPLNAVAAGVICRLWEQVFPELPDITTKNEHHEALYGASIDDAESTIRDKLAVPSRKLGPIDCEGRHHELLVNCVYAHAQPPSQKTTPATDAPT